GFFVLESETRGAEMHKHLQLQFKSGRCLSYHDPRRFGVIEIIEKLPKRVPEPFSGDLTVEWLKQCSESTDRPVKCLIMDQDVIAGLGNIYANEALFRAGIRPDRPADSLSSGQLKKLTHEIIAVVENAVNAGIASLQPYFSVGPDTTHFDIETLVYGLNGQNCPVCRRYQLQKMTLSGRSSFFCPGCQK
ncbi:MAG: Fpg/Nei family DNA glycosylase, partial [Candidatus Rifleibacteriota bacterium]